jgi:dihydroorotase
MPAYDLLLSGGILIDPAQKIHDRRDVAFKDGRVAALADAIPADHAAQVVDAAGRIVAPGLIDLHVHVFEGVSYLGVNPDAECLGRGSTTVVDAGSAGAQTFPGFRKYIIDVSETRIFAQLNISVQGMLTELVGELDDIRWVDVPRALQTIEANRDVILGIKVRLTRDSIVGRSAGIAPLHLAREVADATGLSIMVHPQDAWCESIDDILAVMNDRDILTHTYHGAGHGILESDGNVRHSVLEAAERGVIFDVGHGAGSFSWDVAERALSQGFAPQTISTDIHTQSMELVRDMPTTMSKFLHMGVGLDDVIASSTSRPATAIGMGEQIGTLKPGSWGDAVVLEMVEGDVELRDTAGEARTVRQLLRPVVVVKGGRVYQPAAGDR